MAPEEHIQKRAEFWGSKQCIVTGGGGFLGSHVVEALEAAGCRHIFVVRKARYDLTDLHSVRRLFDDAREARSGLSDAIVMHLAGLSGGIGMNRAFPADFYYQNMMMNTLIFEQAAKNGILSLVAAGAGISYPLAAPAPLNEDTLWDGLPQIESASYALSKRMLQIQSYAYWKQFGLPSTVLILGSLYGPRDNFDNQTAPVIPALITKLVAATEAGHKDVSVWGTGKATRDFLYVKDAALGFIYAAERCVDSQVMKIATGHETSISDVVSILSEITGYQGRIIWDTSSPEGAISRHFDTTKAKTTLGWTAETSLHDGLRATIDWYRNAEQHAIHPVDS